MWEGSGSEQEIGMAEEMESCRMCLERKRPLLRVCGCSGSIGYVHEDCILRWFSSKLEKADPLALPACQLCRQDYSAELKRGRRQLSCKQLLQKVAAKTTGQILWIVLVIVAYAMIPWVMGEGVARLVGGEVEDAVGWLFSRLVFPFFFVWTMRDQRQSWKKEIADCYVQLVEVVLLPQEILR